ncbi:MAG: 30S ribosome-binding factor RbfA [Candidatus Nanopelagicales bacterium]|jgi:ribosome-binding factor A
MPSQARARRLAERIKVIVAQQLEHGVKDPRLGFITVTDARVTGDLREATVFYTVLGDDDERTATAIALESAKGILRSEVGRQTGIKHTPSLTFILDALPEVGRQIDDLLRQAAEADAEVSARATGAEYAGDTDPYRHPAEEDRD